MPGLPGTATLHLVNEESRSHLRPLERCILAMQDRGIRREDIAGAVRRSPAQVERIIGWTQLPRRREAPRRSARALESRVLALRADGESYEQIGRRFKRGARFIRQVEGLAHYRRALDLLG